MNSVSRIVSINARRELLSNEESAQLRKQEEETEKKRAEHQARLEKEMKADGQQQPAKRIHDDTGEGGAPNVARLEAASTAAEAAKGGKRKRLSRWEVALKAALVTANLQDAANADTPVADAEIEEAVIRSHVRSEDPSDRDGGGDEDASS
ncbi:hypothetical protein CYMTET_37935 [Cymbomonas tetramitiformis]|uniref:Uncharacterized protein n=1 Tax=Cymbomonas tetramitiformis TaxID=36881 RepID=A0AAE0F5H1_9CHLO|nr:hypothetical protein CYMTET_37935 [Cymbomonas tetramitiformis]